MNNDRLAYTVLKEVGFTLLDEGKSIMVKAEGYSMYPSVKPGSVIFIAPGGKDPLPEIGEIIAFKKDQGFIVHRLVRSFYRENIKYFVTRGDSSLAEDQPFPSDQLAGKVTRIENSKGTPVHGNILKNRNPNYAWNRFLVRIISQIYRVKRILHF